MNVLFIDIIKLINKYLKIPILIILTLFTSISVLSQNNLKNFSGITTSDGLSHNSGLCILQDHKGFLWIGTQNGLCRYDGYSVKKFFHIPGDTSSLSGNYINSIFQDMSGTVWVGTNKGGINKFNAAKESFKNYQHNPSDPNSIGFG